MADVAKTLNLVKLGMELGDLQWAVRVNATDSDGAMSFDSYNSDKLFLTSKSASYPQASTLHRVDLSGNTPVQDFEGYFARDETSINSNLGRYIQFTSAAIYFTSSYLHSGLEIPIFYRVDRADMT